MSRKKRKYNVEEVKALSKISKNYSDILKKLGMSISGGSFKSLKYFMEENNIKIINYKTGNTGGWNKEPIDKLLVKNKYVKSYNLKNRLIKLGIKKWKCEICGIEEWNGKIAPLELDHINGINTDNRIENLRIICPNCHAQTDTNSGKNNKRL